MNISIIKLKRYVENGYEVGLLYNSQRYSITHNESKEDLLNLNIIENTQWRIVQQFASFDALSADAIIEDDSFEAIWAKAIEISIEKMDLATLIRTIRFGELEFRVRHKRYFAEGASGGYYCISLDEKDEDGDPVCYDFDAKPMAKSFDMFMNAKIFEGMTFSEAYNEMTIIKGVFFEE